MKKFDYLVVGSGLYGAIFAHEAKAHGKSVLVVDKRPNIAGNIYTENVEGINVHKYGAHIFHTNNKNVWNSPHPEKWQSPRMLIDERIRKFAKFSSGKEPYTAVFYLCPKFDVFRVFL